MDNYSKVKIAIPPLMQVSIIESTGITACHRAYFDETIDEVLFSGFSAALVAFSKELGRELHALEMEGITYYYATCNGFIFIVGVHPKVSHKHSRELLKEIMKAVDWETLEEYLNKLLYFQTEEFEEKMNEIIAEFQFKLKDEILNSTQET
ncbi:MAG: hypothetical protein ACTSYD_00500 [Candidatus Heimdallarchaeaceae archaeon]